MIKRLDFNILKAMGLDKDSGTDWYFEFDVPITRLEFVNGWRIPYGETLVDMRVYNRDKLIFYAASNKTAFSLTLFSEQEISDYEEISEYTCADPRIVASYILAFWICRIAIEAGHDIKALDRICRHLTNWFQCFTQTDAIEWLQRNGLTGRDREERARQIYRGETEMAYVPPSVQHIYDRYIGDWRVANQKKKTRKALRDKWQNKPKEVLQAELDRLYKTGDDETAELFEAEFGYLLEDDDFNGKVGDIRIKE